MNAPAEDDLVTRLRSEDGQSHRARVLQQLDELDARVRAALDAGQPKASFEDLQAVRLAVAACRTTLDRLNLRGLSGDRGPLHPSITAASDVT